MRPVAVCLKLLSGNSCMDEAMKICSNHLVGINEHAVNYLRTAHPDEVGIGGPMPPPALRLVTCFPF